MKETTNSMAITAKPSLSRQLGLLLVLAHVCGWIRTPAVSALVAPETTRLFRQIGTAANGDDDSSPPPSDLELTKALLDVSKNTQPPEDNNWSRALGQRSPWRAYFSASQDNFRQETSGRFLPNGFGCQTFVPTTEGTGTFSNKLSPLAGLVEFCLGGSYSLKGRIMTLEFQELNVKLLWFLSLPAIDIREGSGIRNLIEQTVRGGKKNTKTFQKRPNIYSWCYVDENVCVAQGSSGSVALWISEADTKTS